MDMVLRAHILPLTNVAFNKSGSSFITGSYDRTCKVWDTASGEELHTLEGHHNAVYAIQFNNPYGTLIATGSMDTTAKLWDIQSVEEALTLSGHAAEIISLSFNTTGDRLITGSFDHTVSVWEIPSGRRIHTLIGHRGEISSAQINWDCSLIATASMDTSCKVQYMQNLCLGITNIRHILAPDLYVQCFGCWLLWDSLNGKCVATLTGHEDEVLDVTFDTTRQLVATASADVRDPQLDQPHITHLNVGISGIQTSRSPCIWPPLDFRFGSLSALVWGGTARVYSASSRKCLAKLEGHEGEISKICINAQGNRILTASSDKTSRLWDPHTGECLQVLKGHTDEIFSCAFNYEGNTIITGSKDNTCRIWR
ncbi:hypothetical protein XELAEV_18027900mg [Xenopus laevis]|uniref:Dynein assembly factor with WD repeat domains 1 n=1 Tax=Xenopus laevis TaxID=8355 RepID=A0A974CYL8_XENLA|nr:hypothetical protein XELAEV_18027900mg [Xenopus laevis]